MALRWREEGAQIVGGCCGVRPEHIAAAARAPARARRPATGGRPTTPGAGLNGADAAAPAAAARAVDRPPPARRCTRCRSPTSASSPAWRPPGAASFMAWRYLFREGIGAHQRCLDIGCGTGILAVQLALNGAAHVRALDIDDRAVANTLANAFRNGVADRVTAETVDLFPWVPEERYEVIVASLYQQPTDPFARVSSHRLPDYWGRNLVDQLIAKLSEALAPEGVAYVVQLSILSQRHTADALAAARLRRAGVDYTLFSFPPEQEESRAQIGRVEELSDAYHLAVGEEQVMVAYLLEVTATPDRATRSSRASAWPAALEGSAEDVLAAHRAVAAALDADPDDAELRRLHRELVDEGAIARLQALERVRAAVGRLADAGPVSEIIDRAPAEAAAALDARSRAAQPHRRRLARGRGAALRGRRQGRRADARAPARRAGADRLPADRGRAAAPPPRRPS